MACTMVLAPIPVPKATANTTTSEEWAGRVIRMITANTGNNVPISPATVRLMKRSRVRIAAPGVDGVTIADIEIWRVEAVRVFLG